MNAWQPGQQKFVEPVVFLSHLFVELFLEVKGSCGPQIPGDFSEIKSRSPSVLLLWWL